MNDQVLNQQYNPEIPYLWSYNLDIAGTYIITIEGNEKSQELAKRCKESCEEVGQPLVEYAAAFDGTKDGIVKVPNYYKGAPWLKWIKLHTDVLSPTQIAVYYSHFALWCRCLEMDQPIVILEHDAVMVKSFPAMPVYNSIVYLGSSEQYKDGNGVYNIPPHGTAESGRNRFICRAHAYAIDSAIAKNLISHTIKYGITTSLDVHIRSDLFPITQFGLYAYDDYDGSTIHKDWKYLEKGL